MAAHVWAVNIRPFLSSHTAQPGYKASSLVNQPTFLLLILCSLETKLLRIRVDLVPKPQECFSLIKYTLQTTNAAKLSLGIPLSHHFCPLFGKPKIAEFGEKVEWQILR